MMWIDYNIEQVGDNFRVVGDWPEEVWLNKDGTEKEQRLYQPGDKFIVNKKGWLVKVGESE